MLGYVIVGYPGLHRLFPQVIGGSGVKQTTTDDRGRRTQQRIKERGVKKMAREFNNRKSEVLSLTDNLTQVLGPWG
jgi:hypothetical protein